MPFDTKRNLDTACANFIHRSFLKAGLAILCLLIFTQSKAQAPVPDFRANVVSGCAPLSVQFTDLSTGNPVFWNWDLGNGQLSTLQNPQASYNTPGVYTITLVVRNASGINSITKTNYIVVNPSPSPDFFANNTIACVPAVVQFSDASIPNAGTVTNWQWDFGDGTTSTLQNPQKTYSTTGFYTVSLRVTTSTGCQALITRGNYIRVVSGVTADFSTSVPATCQPPFLINFTDLTSGPGNITYQWDFGNSTSSTLQNPIATYTTPGTYTVQLTATSQYGCSGTIQKPITIGSIATTIGSPDTVCLNTTVTFLNPSSPVPIRSVWDFGNGTGSVKLSDTSSYNTPGTYSVKLINTYSDCVDSTTKNIVVLPRPTVDFTAPNTVSCSAPFTVNFQDISTNAVAWNWDFGDGGSSNAQNPTHQYTTPGQYTVTLTITDNRGCQNTVVKSSFVRIVPPIVAVANAPAGGCAPFNYQPVAAASSVDGITNYFWDYGDGFTFTGQFPPAHNYALGTYTLKLVITTTGGCIDSVVYTNGIRVGFPSNNGFTASPLDVCAGDSVSFVADPSTIADTWSWNFGDGGNSPLKNPRHAFQDTGYFSITLTATNNGCSLSFARNLYVHVKPGVAKFGYTVNCSNKRLVNFSDSSITDPGYGPISYLWEFGDPANSTSTAINPTFTYPQLGTYQVKLTVTNGACSNTFTRTLVLTGDIADFTVSKTNVCRNEQVTVTAINSNPATVVSYQWSFNNLPYVTAGPVTTVAYSGVFANSVALAIEDVNGCRDTIVKNGIIITAGPYSLFSPSLGSKCMNKQITFLDSSTANGAPIVKWTFDFGDGNRQVFNAPPFTHTYTDTGLFSIRLTVEDAAGCIDAYVLPSSLLITNPIAKFSSATDSICQGANLLFRDSSSGLNLTYNWTFGDGASSTLRNPSHVYTGADNQYTVKLVVTDSVGCQDSLVRTNSIVVRSPKPAFDIKDTSTICPPLETKFTFRGSDYQSYYWDFGDGSTSTLRNPNHFYNQYGTFTAKLVLIGYGGCLDSSSSNVTVHNPSTETIINYGPVTACNDLMVDYNITTPPGTRFTFYSGDGYVDSSQRKTFQYFYKSFGIFTPEIILIDSLKCQVGRAGTTAIRILGAEPLFGVDKKTFCDSSIVLFANYTIGNDPVVSSVWNFGDGNNSTQTNPAHLYNSPGTYIPSLTVTTQAGCSKTLTDTLRVYPTPLTTITGDTIVCIGEQALLTANLAQPDSTVKWSWTMGNGTNITGPIGTAIYNQAGRYPVLLSAVNTIGCTGDTTVTIFVPQNPVINILNNPVTIPVNASIPIPVTYGTGNIATYAWTPANGLSCFDCPVPVANPKSTTTFKVTATDIYGCRSSNEITVIVVCNEKNYFVPNTFSPNNDGNNDVFYPRGNGLARIQSMRIFNRWGEMVFERRNFNANDPSMGWDGTSKGKKGETDTYVYIVEFVCENSVIIPFKGNVTLIR